MMMMMMIMMIFMRMMMMLMTTFSDNVFENKKGWGEGGGRLKI